MPTAIAIAVVLLLVSIRLLFPPVPGLLKNYAQRWGARKTVLLSAISVAGAALAILISRR
jgi:hypothetical protein